MVSHVSDEQSAEGKPVTLVVFGAGASAFCVENGQGCPPLTADLVEALRRFGVSGISALLHVIDEFQESNPDSNFEETLRSLFESFSSDSLMKKQFDNLRSRLRELMRSFSGAANSGNAYEVFFDQFLSSTERRDTGERLAVVNMNYDSLAERALNGRQLFDKMDDHVMRDDRPIGLYHPHGAAEWGMLPMHEGASEGRQVLVRPFAAGLSPAIALPMSGDPQNKTCWPPSQEAELSSLLPLVTKICVVGWRGADKHIVDFMLSGLNPKKVKTFHLVGTNSVSLGTTFQLLAKWSSVSARTFEAGFLGYVRGGSRVLFPTVLLSSSGTPVD
jgi:hypothetical protein